MFSHFLRTLCDVYVVFKLTDWLTTAISGGEYLYRIYIFVCIILCVSLSRYISTRWITLAPILGEIGCTYFTMNKPTVSEHLPRLKVYQWYARFHRLCSLKFDFLCSGFRALALSIFHFALHSHNSRTNTQFHNVLVDVLSFFSVYL